jgi:hypothetical protein
MNDLRVSTLHDSCSIDFTYNFNMDHFSFIDHFIVPAAVHETCFGVCSVRHDGNNLSDHDPILLSSNVDWNLFSSSPRHYSDKCIWHKASAEDLVLYKQSSKADLSAVRVTIDAFYCHDVVCSDKSHFAALNDYSTALLTACLKCLKSALHTNPHSSCSYVNHSSEVLPGWNEHVAPLRDKSMLWHDIWVGCGLPHDGLVASIMRRTRASYHYAVRYVKSNRLDIIKDRFAIAILNNRDRDFWREAKKIGGGKSGP